mgnify:CR=1 FL=1
MTERSFIKMHGLGNDFAIFDARDGQPGLTGPQAAAIADRRRGIGCDQVIVMEPSTNGADVFMRIFNPDGSEAGACGNATRCVAHLIGTPQSVIETRFDHLKATLNDDGTVTVDMGEPRFDWADIPLARAMDTRALAFSYDEQGLSAPSAVSMGNPHVIFFVEDADSYPLALFGAEIECDPLFPERTNVELATVRPDGSIRLRVFERGAGITQACGSGACATLVAAARTGRTGRKAAVDLDGGVLTIEWTDQNRVLMTGPVAHAFDGTVPL